MIGRGSFCNVFDYFQSRSSRLRDISNSSGSPARQGTSSERAKPCSECTEVASQNPMARSVSNGVLLGASATDPSTEALSGLQIPQPAASKGRQTSNLKGKTMPGTVTTDGTTTGVDTGPAQEIANRLNALNTQIANMGVSVAENTAGSDLAKSKGKQAST